MLHSRKVKVGAVAACAVALTAGMASSANADMQPRATDVVGVGSDTVQYVVDFVADGAPALNGNPAAAGFNTINDKRRLISFDATADSSGRAVYGPGGAATSPSIVLRTQTSPVSRPNGSGGGITALLNDTSHAIDYVRSSRLPTAAEQSTAAGKTGFGAGLHVYQIATDGLQIAVNNTGTGTLTNAPTALSCNDLVNIYSGTYKKWSDVPNYAGAAPADGIVPVIPQSGSGTAKDFLADLKACNANTAITLGSNVVTSEEHDPAGITSVTAHTDVNGNPVSKLDAIAPFSTGRDKLIDSGYFGTTPAPNQITLLDPANGSYLLNRFLYILVRDADVSSSTAWQVGGTQNWVKTLFGASTSYFAKSAQSADFTAAGVTQAWVDKGLASNN